jgi:hypothetical protein
MTAVMATRVSVSVRVLVIVVVVAAIIGAGARGLLIGTPTSDVAPVTPGPADRPQPRDARTEHGAIAAAVAYVRAGQRIYELPPAQRETALRDLAAPSAADGYVADQARRFVELDRIAARGQGPLTWHVSALATRVDALTHDRARVQIWRLGVLSIEGLTAPLAEYTTVTYELLWHAGGWRIWSETQTPGPTPMGHPEATPSSPGEWRGALEGFARYPGTQPI